MNASDKRKKLRRRRARLICVFGALSVCSILLCGAAFVNTISVEHKADVPPSTTKSPSEGKDILNSKTQQPKVDTSIIDKSEWKLLLVNPWNKLPADFTVELTTLKSGHAIDKRAYPDLQAMMDDAREEGLSPIICSSYRTQEKQQSLFDKQVSKYVALGYSKENAEKETGKWVAVHGTSEHQTGLAVDIVASSYQMLNEKQAATAEQKWLMENSYKYGFILRYNSDKGHITGIEYEPWHYRYVGKEAAKEIYVQGICLEEYLTN